MAETQGYRVISKAYGSSANVDPSNPLKEYFSKDEIKRRMEEDRERV
jgi:hypothetical protein